MKDLLDSVERVFVAENLGGDDVTVDDAFFYRLWKHFFNQQKRFTVRFQQIMNRFVSIMNGNSEPPEIAGNGRLAHADGAGQPENDHPGRPSKTWALKSSVTSGSMPNQWLNPGRA